MGYCCTTGSQRKRRRDLSRMLPGFVQVSGWNRQLGLVIKAEEQVSAMGICNRLRVQQGPQLGF